MSLKQHTIIFVPHARARFRKVRVTNRQIAIAGGAVLFIAAASIFTTWAFFTNTVDRNQLATVRTENEELRKINQSFETSIRTLERQLVSFEERTRKLAIVAGIDALSADSNIDVGVGGGSAYLEAGPAETLDLLESRVEELSGELSRVSDGLDQRHELINSTPSLMPVHGIFTSRFGRRLDPVTRKPASHHGIDIATAPGRPVHVTADGIVVRAGRSGGLGNAVYVSHGYGVTTRYGHLSSIAVRPGQRVRQKDIVGEVGSTGKSTGYHLHYEVRVDGKAQNPMIYILDRPGRG